MCKTPGRYFRRLLISAAALILIPLLVVVILYVNGRYEQQKHGAIADYEKAIAWSAGAVDQQLSSVTRFASTLAAENMIKELNVAAFAPLKAPDIRTQLNIHRSANDFFSEIYLYVPAHGVIYTSAMVSPDTDGLISIYIDDEPYQKNMLNAQGMYGFARHKLTYPATSKGIETFEQILYTAPIYKRGSIPTMTVTVAVNEGMLESFLSERLTIGDEAPHAYLLDEQDKVIYANSANGNMADLATQSTAVDFAVIDNVRHRIFRVRSALLGYSYLVVISERALFSRLIFPVVWILLVIGIGIFFAVCALTIFLHANYAPIRNINALVRKYISESGADEIDSIRDTIEMLETRVEELGTQIDVGKDAQFRTFLLDLLNGSNGGDAAMLAAWAAEFSIPAGTYAAVLVDSADMAAFAGRMRPAKLYRPGIADGDYDCCLCCLPAGFDDEGLRALLEASAEAMRKSHFDIPSVCAGSLCDQLSGLPYSYMEAKATSELQHVMGRSVMLYKDIALLMPMRRSMRHALPDCVELARAVSQRDAAGIHAFVEEIVQFFVGCDMPMVEMRRLLFDIHNAVYTVAQELSERIAPVRALFELRTRDEAIEMLRSIEHTLLMLDREDDRSLVKPNMNEMEAYIKARFKDHDFSIRSMATLAGISFPYFSQLFKQAKGVSPVEYVTKLRIGSAQKLLQKTDLSISEIVDRVGYYSVSSFIKRFRQYVGVTPGEYRNQCQMRDRQANNTRDQ